MTLFDILFINHLQLAIIYVKIKILKLKIQTNRW